jgi:TetR/AcrR family transcriptional repressor of nem operon
MARPNVREQIVDAGLKCLLEKGFNGVGVQEITTVAGVPKGSFYNHFESKEALGAEIVARYGKDNARRLHLHDTSIPALERLRRHFETKNATFVASKYERGCLLGNFAAELSNQSPMIRESLQGLFGRWAAELTMTIREAQTTGAIATKTDAADLASFILDAYEGALLRGRVERNSQAFDRFMKLVFGQLLT